MGPCGLIFLFGLAFPTRIRGEQLYVFSFDSNLTGCKAAIFGQHTYDMRLETFHGDSTTKFQSIIEGNDSNIISYQGQQAFNSYSNGFYVALDPRCRSLCNPLDSQRTPKQASGRESAANAPQWERVGRDAKPNHKQATSRPSRPAQAKPTASTGPATAVTEKTATQEVRADRGGRQ